MTNSLTYSLYSKLEYIDALIALFDGCAAGNRILLMTMGFTPDDPAVKRLMRSLDDAASRGAHVTFSVDARAFLEGKHAVPGPLWFSPKLSGSLRGEFGTKYRILQKIGNHPHARTAVINIPQRRFSLAIAGRSHIKTAIIDNKVFVGGCNLDASGNTDLMAGWEDARTADELYNLMTAGIGTGNIRRSLRGFDRTIALDDRSSLLIDSGVPGQSLIFERALHTIDAARQWLLLTCQFFPNSITAQHLLRSSKRGVKTEIIYSHPFHHGFIGGVEQYLNLAIEHTRLPRRMFKDRLPHGAPKIHAKLLATDKAVMIGSHNYVHFGVRLGTAEIALLSSDPQLAVIAREKIRGQLSK